MKEHKTSFVRMRVTERDHVRLEREAQREGLNTSTFVRMIVCRELTQREQRQTLAGVAA